MDINKTAFLSGKLSGTKTLKNELKDIKNPDLYENFLIEYTNLKFDIKKDNEVIYINDNQDVEEKISEIEKSEYISISINKNFNRVYITTDERKTYAVRINKINQSFLSNLISKEKPKKFMLNSFTFVKWCNERKIDIRNIYDIQTFIKILTNRLDLEKTITRYIEEFTTTVLIEDDNEQNNIVIGNFIYEFGKYLEQYINKFELINMCKLINENAYFESLSEKNEGNCEILFSYIELNNTLKNIIEKSKNDYKEKAYVLSPLGRIALKFSRKEEELLNEIYLEDLEMLILNELYNNNIHVKLLEDNLYKVTCKFKNFNNIISLITAILEDVFNNLFEENCKIKIECVLE